MNTQVAITEIEVLVGVAVWLYRNRKVLPYEFSIARGNGIDLNLAKSMLDAALDREGVSAEGRSFVSKGPDIKGISEKEHWQIDCKGAGLGQIQTQRNNFDRALASAVSYYSKSPPQFAARLSRDCRPVLGLALADTPVYRSLLKQRVTKDLREALNLWVLLYNPSCPEKIRPVLPDAEY